MDDWLFMILFCPYAEAAEAAERNDAGYQIAYPMQWQMEAFRRNKDVTAAHHCHK